MMIDAAAMIERLEAYKADFNGSLTNDNKSFVEGTIYGLDIAKAYIEGQLKHKNCEELHNM